MHDPPVTRELPAGTVTFLFTDVEGSTKLLHALGAEAYADALMEHRRILREAFSRHGGVEVDTQGDAFFVAFPTAPGALAAAREASEALSTGPIRVRIGLHTGTPLLTDEGYVGADVHRAARIAAAGHGGQILVSSATAALLDTSDLRDLGDHRLKDLTAPERIYQADPGEHPPLKTLYQTNLPVPATPFLGRDVELAELSELLTRDDVRLATLTGPGGTGKTRLALAAAGASADAFPAGVWWVPLAALRDPALVLPSAATALGASGDLAEHIGDKKLLLLLDNFEHLTDAAAGLAPLLTACANLTVLVTSREPLHLVGEHEYAVDPLQPAEAVELFLTRAAAARRDFSADGEVALICERLDRLPLAIELAAARVKVLSAQALLQRLEQRLPLLAGGARDLPERQRTLRATIEWSHELLTDDEQRLFACLGVFRGGWTLEAAEAILDADLDMLQSLVDKSLVRVRTDSGRFWMLETIREFAGERLTGLADSSEVRDRHADHYLELAERLGADAARDASRWLTDLEAEHDNLRAALDWLAEVGKHENRQRLAGELARFWYTRGHIVEGRSRLEDAIAADAGRTSARASALNGMALLNAEGGDEARVARQHAEEALSIYDELEDDWGSAYSRLMIAAAMSDAAEWEAARAMYEESRRHFEAIGDEHHVLLATRLLAWMHFELGDIGAARAVHDENLARARRLGNLRIIGTTLGALGEYDIRERNLGSAASRLTEAYSIFRGLGHSYEVAVELLRFAWLLARAGRPEAAARVLGRCLLAYEHIGGELPAWVAPMLADCRAEIQAQLDADTYAALLEAGRAMPVDEAVALVLDATADS